MEFVEVTLIHITNGNEYYEVKQSDGRKKRGTYKVGDDFWYENELHQQPISKSTKALFEATHDKFVEQVTRAKNGQDGYMVVSIDNYYVAYKRLLQEAAYDFILTCDRYTRIFTNTTIYDFHRSLILPSDSPQEEKSRLEKVTHSLLESALSTHDLYLAYALKECLGTITQSEADYLLSIDRIYRFVPENKIYDMGDLEILDVQSGAYTFSSRTVNFTCDVKIKDIVYKAIWKPNDTKYSNGGYPPYKVDLNSNPNELLILSKVFYRKIKISDLVKGTIDSIAYNNLTRTYTLLLPITPDSPEKGNRIKAKVRKLGFGIKEYIGRFIENGSTIDERILLVFDITIKKAKELGKEFGLSSIIYKDHEGCREICISPFTYMEKVNDQEVTQTYYPDDIVRVYHNTYPNEDLIKEILFTRRGPVGVDFELYEVEQPRPSYFQDKEHLIKINSITGVLDKATKRKRIFAYVENNMDKGKPSVLYAISDDNKHFFKYEIYDKSSDYEDYVKLFLHNHDNGNLPAWKAYIKFEDFCLKECGFTDTNDEVIFANSPNPMTMDFFNYIADRLGAVEWALVKFIEFNYQYETTHLEKPMSFKEFRKTYETGLPEPYATKHLYDEYTRLIHKEQYTLEELNRMEQYVKSHLKDLFGTKSLYSETEIRIGWICAAMYKTDMERYLALMDFIIDEYKKETYPQTPLEELIDIISGYVIEDEYIDQSIWDEEEKKPLMDRPEYQMFKNLRADNVEFIKKALESYKTKLK